VPAFIADLKSLSAKELEVRAIHASRFHRNWCSSHPRSRRNVEFPTRELIPEDDSSLQLSKDHPHPISQVLFPPGHNGELLITVEKNRVACWEIPFEGSEAFLVAERYISVHTIDGVVLNDDTENEAMLIVMFSRIVDMWACFLRRPAAFVTHLVFLGGLLCMRLGRKFGRWTNSMVVSRR
jgi:hypothetical protein